MFGTSLSDDPCGKSPYEEDTVIETERRAPMTDTSIAAVFVLGLEAVQGTLTIGDYQVAVQRLERAIRPWDSVLDIAPRTVGVVCSALSNSREIEAVAVRLADVVRAPMAVSDEVHTVGVCVGSAVVGPGENTAEAFTRARVAMQQMRKARAGLLAPDVPQPR